MSKRTFDDFSTITSNSRYASVLGRVNGLLKAAESLKKDLERLGHSGDDENINSTLDRHNVAILSAAQQLSQDETANMRKVPEGSHKLPKLGQNEDTSDGRLQSALLVPHPELLTKWTPQDVPRANELPPLPPVLNPILEKAARTHSGIAGQGEMHYEKLEWIGDAYLYLVSSAFIYQTFPGLSTGRCSQLRERLIKNEALSEVTTQYGIDKRACLPREFDPDGRQSRGSGGTSASQRERKKILGDLLEAYTAAAILGDTDGLSRVVPWLKSIWGTVLEREISDEYKSLIARGYSNAVSSKDSSTPNDSENPNPKNLDSKVVLVQTIGMKGVTISYRDQGKTKKDKNSGLPWFTVGAYYDGPCHRDLLIGYGSGLSKKEAGANAATQALKNKKLIKTLKTMKDEFNAAHPKPKDP